MQAQQQQQQQQQKLLQQQGNSNNQFMFGQGSQNPNQGGTVNDNANNSNNMANFTAMQPGMGTQMIQLQQQMGMPQHNPIMNVGNMQLMAALGGMQNQVPNMAGFGGMLAGGNMQQVPANNYIQQLFNQGNIGATPAPTGGMIHGNPAMDQAQLLQIVASLANQGGNPAAAALFLSQLNTNGALRNSDPPGSVSGVESTNNRARLTIEEEKARALAMMEGKSPYPSPGLMGRDPVPLYMSCDDERLSAYHALARRHMEFFEAGQDDISTNARGRNRPIVLGQVGIRCKHCSHLPPRRRQRAAMYYPFKLDLLYQACQTLANVHLCEQCQHFPADVRTELVKLRGEKTTALVVRATNDCPLLLWNLPADVHPHHIFLFFIDGRAKSIGRTVPESMMSTSLRMACAFDHCRATTKRVNKAITMKSQLLKRTMILALSNLRIPNIRLSQ